MSTPKALKLGVRTQAQVWVVSPKDRKHIESLREGRTVLIANNVELAMAVVIAEYFMKSPYRNAAVEGIDSSARIGKHAQISDDARIGPFAFIGTNVKIGRGTYIGASSVIEDDSEIGENTVIHPLVYIGHSTLIGNDCEIHPSSVVGKEGFGYAHDEKGRHYRIPHTGRVVIEDNVHLGSGTVVDRATFGETRIESGAKFDNKVHVAHNVSIGRNSLVTAGATFAGSSRVGANFLCGGHSVVTGHITVCDNVQLAALSAVSKSITQPGKYGGNPLMPLQDFIRAKAAIAHLARMRKHLKHVMKKLGIADDDGAEESSAEV